MNMKLFSKMMSLTPFNNMNAMKMKMCSIFTFIKALIIRKPNKSSTCYVPDTRLSTLHILPFINSHNIFVR